VEPSETEPGLEYSLFLLIRYYFKKKKFNSEIFQNMFINKLLKSADVILQFFSYQLNRDKIIDFGNYFPSKDLISILSTPIFKPENVFKLFFTFDYLIWILLFLSFITYSLINTLVINTNMRKISIFIDYFGLLAGQGMKKF
jgi:hypothetical protein